MRDSLDQFGLWTYLWGIGIIKVGRPTSMDSTFSHVGALDCVSVEMCWTSRNAHAFVLLLLSTVDVTGCFMILLPFLCNDGLMTSTYKWNNASSLRVACFSQGDLYLCFLLLFYPSNRDTTRILTKRYLHWESTPSAPLVENEVSWWWLNMAWILVSRCFSASLM